MSEILYLFGRVRNAYAIALSRGVRDLDGVVDVLVEMDSIAASTAYAWVALYERQRGRLELAA